MSSSTPIARMICREIKPACQVTPASRNRFPMHCKRRGAVLVVVMVCLLVVSLICASIVRLAVAEYRQIRLQEWRLQAEWLAESAAERAAAKLNASQTYTGETWNVPASQCGGRGNGVVTIAVKSGAEKPDQYEVSIRAEFRIDDEPAARHAKQVLMKRKTNLTGEKS